MRSWSASCRIACVVLSSGFLCGCGGSGNSVPTLNITTPSLPDGTIGTTYTQIIQATGGVAPFTWTVASGALPDNLSLASGSGASVTLSGMPDRVQSKVAFTIRITDSKGDFSSQPVSSAGADGESRLAAHYPVSIGRTFPDARRMRFTSTRPRAP